MTVASDSQVSIPKSATRSRINYCEVCKCRCASPKLDPACIFNNFIRQLAARIDDAILQLQQSRLPLPTLAAALLSAPAHPWRVINASEIDGNTRNRISGYGVHAFR